MNLLALPAFTDNYIWMFHNGRQAAVVDPGDAAPVHAALNALGLELAAILVTHHHADHIGGVPELMPQLRGTVFAPARERIPAPAVPVHTVAEGDVVTVLGLEFAVLEVPGHTVGHIAYLQQAGPAPWLFCGDTLFSAGCGRLFEGTPRQMHASLQRLRALPDATAVCCTHEYTLSNLRFARAVEPDNEALAEHESHCRALRARGQATLPSSMALERRINPFLRCTEPVVIAAARHHGADDDGEVAVFAALREWKNRF